MAFEGQQAQGGGRQSGAAAPFKGLFGNTPGTRDAKHEIDLRLSGDSIWDDAVVTDAAQLQPDRPLNGHGIYYGADAGLTYAWRARPVSLQAATDGAFRYYPGLRGVKFVSESSSVSAQAGRGRTTFTGAAALFYSPYYSLLSLFSDISAPVVSPLDLAAARHPTVEVFASALLSRRIGRSNNVSVGYSQQNARFTDGERSFTAQTATMSASRQWSRNLDVHATYGYRITDYGRGAPASARYTAHQADGGFAYRPWGAGRRGHQLTLDVNLGASLYETGTRTIPLWHASLQGQAAISRRWTASGRYERGLQFSWGVGQPALMEMGTASVGGFINSRLSVSLSGGYSTGSQQPGPVTSRFKTYFGTTGIQYALNRELAFAATYVYYQYDFGTEFPLPAGMPHRLGRDRVTVQANLWLPLLRVGRTEPAPANK
jgi:hypothetical protein